jgi:hypothetical protein
LDRHIKTSLDYRAQLTIAALVAITGAPLRVVDDSRLQNWLNSFLNLARESPALEFGPDGIPLSAYRTRQSLLQYGEWLRRPAINRFADKGIAVTLRPQKTIRMKHRRPTVPFRERMFQIRLLITRNHISIANRQLCPF